MSKLKIDLIKEFIMKKIFGSFETLYNIIK